MADTEHWTVTRRVDSANGGKAVIVTELVSLAEWEHVRDEALSYKREAEKYRRDFSEAASRVILLEGALAEAISIIGGGRNPDSARNRKAEEWRELLNQ